MRKNKKLLKNIIILLIFTIIFTTPISVYADTKNKDKDKNKNKYEKYENEKKYPIDDESYKIWLAENEEKIMCEESDGTKVNLEFKHGKFNTKPKADVKDKGQTLDSPTNHCIIVDIRNGDMCVFVFQGRKGHRQLIKKAPCSSAKNIAGTKISSTPSGKHHINWKTPRLVYTNKDGKKWQYWSCSMTWQGWGIHSLTYALKASKYERKYLWGGQLGAHNSPACIRTENWLADWIYNNCGIGTTIYVISR